MNISKYKKLKIYFLILLSTLLFELSLVSGLSAEPPDDELSKIGLEKEETQEKIEDIKKKESEYINEINDLEDDLLTSLDELNALNTEISEVKSNIDNITLNILTWEKEIRQLEKSLEEKTDILNERIISIYKEKDKNILEVILSSKDFLQLMSNLKMMNILAKQDAQAISDIKKERLLLINKRMEMIDAKAAEEDKKKELERLLAQADIKKEELEQIYIEKKELLSVTTANKEALMVLENQLQLKEIEINESLKNLTSGNAPSGKLLFPVNGKISSGFGYRTSLSGNRRFHSGIDLYAPSGTPIYSCENGQVIKAEYHGGYGYSILIYHGGGMATFYAHLSGFAVDVGQNVVRGQLIGYVGTTGYTTGPHLHLEVRINGEAQNPINFI